MYRKIVWCYVFVLTLLDITLNTKLSAQGKSHGVTVHHSLIEGITFQEWGAEATAEGVTRGRAAPPEALSLSPDALHFGRAALAAAHALTVTLTNTANTTVHLASVAGTTPDFHASFFESKTLPPQANTTFSVVYLGRREGLVSAHLYIHTSLGVHKYPVSAVGVASEWDVWPLVGVRVPLNATVEPLLTMHNPTDTTIQVSEVYSSAAWLGLRLPGGGDAAPRDAWTLPPHATRALVRLRLRPPAAADDHPHQPLTAYIRIKANMTGGGLVVCVEARGAAPGEYLSPLQLRLRARGSRDPPDTFEVEAGNSLNAGVRVEASVWGARCGSAPDLPPDAPARANGHADRAANGAGVGGAGGAQATTLRAQLDAHQPLARAATLTLDYAKMWAGRGAGGEAWCGGWVRVGRAALPYSVRVLPGTLRLLPDALHFVTASREEALRPRDVRAHNQFDVPVLIARLDYPPDLEEFFDVESLAPVSVGAGASADVARVRLRAGALGGSRVARISLRTNLTDYALPVLLYSGKLVFDWEWPNSSDGDLAIGAVGTSSTRRVGVRVRNTGPAPLCVTALHADLPGAHLALAACPDPPDHACRCVEGWGSTLAWLTVVAPAREGALEGSAVVATAHAQTRASITLHAHAGRVHALPLHLYSAAPYAWSSTPLVLESSMTLRMRVVNVTQPEPDPAVTYVPAAERHAREVGAGRRAVGAVVFAPERLCAPHCYTGLAVGAGEGAAWLRRAAAPGEGARDADAALQRARHALYAQLAAGARNISLHVHTTQVVRIPVRGSAQWWWPRLASGAGAAGLAGVGGAVTLRVAARNPSRTHALLLQPVLGGPAPALYVPPGGAAAPCRGACAWAADAFALRGWRAARGAARAWEGAEAPPRNESARAMPLLLLEPDAEIEIEIEFAPKEASALAAYLYLRNNLTILEAVQLSGRGAYPSFELGGRRPGSTAPLLFEVSGCADEAEAGGGTVQRTVVARNTGAVPVRLREWRLAGQPCQARGFRLRPCAPLRLAPNESRALRLAFTPDYTLARVSASLRLRTDLGRAEFHLAAAAPARLLPRCHRRVPRPPFEPALRAAGVALALAALALALAAAALDAERALRRARAPRAPPAARAPLDLRALAEPAPAPPPPPPRPAPAPRRRRLLRRRAPPLDAHAERRAFERWRADVLRRADEDDSRSSEDADADREPARVPDPPPPPEETTQPARDEPPPPAPPREDDGSPEGEAPPPTSGEDDAVSTGSGTASASSSPADERDEGEAEDEERRRTPTERESAAPPTRPSAPADSPAPPTARQARARARRSASPPPRRPERAADAGRARGAPARLHARKERSSRRRGERAAASPPRSPPRPAAVRWGASWSSVVAAGAGAAAEAPPLAPIGSDVPRRPAADRSLFYFNGEPAGRAGGEYAWRAPAATGREAPAGGFRSLEALWGGAEARPAPGAWPWGGAELRPPPGFPPTPRPVRPYDPFRSLASIWTPVGLDWRAEAPDDDNGNATLNGN